MNPRIYLLALGTFALGTDAFVIAGVLPAVGRDLNVSVDTAGLLVAIFSLTYGLGAPLLAAFTSQIARHQLLLAALTLFALSNILSAIAPNFILLLLTRVLAGCCAALYSPTAYTVATTLAPPQKRGQALAIVIAGLSLSTVFGVPLGTWIGQSLHWRATFGLVALLAVVAVIILQLVGLPQIALPPSVSLRTRLAPITNPTILVALLPMLLWSAGTFCLYTYITPFLQQITHVQNVSGLLLVYGVGGIIGSWGAGWSVDRFGSVRPLIAWVITLMAILLVLPWAAANIVSAVIILFLWGIAGWSLFPPQQNRLLNLAPTEGNLVLALNNSAFYLGTSLGATFGGVVLSSMGVAALGWWGSGTTLIALLVLGFSLRTAKPAATKPTRHQVEVTEGIG